MGYNSVFVSDLALNSSSVSSPQQIVDSNGYSIQLAFNQGTTSFSCEIEVSSDPYFVDNNPNLGMNTPINWDILANSSQTFTVNGTFTYNVDPAQYVWVRLVITDNSSGANTGVLQATINVKGPL